VFIIAYIHTWPRDELIVINRWDVRARNLGPTGKWVLTWQKEALSPNSQALQFLMFWIWKTKRELDVRVARFFLVQYTKTGKMYQNGENIPKGHKICQLAGKLTKWPWNIPTSSIASPSKIYPNWDFWFETKTIRQPCSMFALGQREKVVRGKETTLVSAW
jgi:hypothetical protein